MLEISLVCLHNSMFIHETGIAQTSHKRQRYYGKFCWEQNPTRCLDSLQADIMAPSQFQVLIANCPYQIKLRSMLLVPTGLLDTFMMSEKTHICLKQSWKHCYLIMTEGTLLCLSRSLDLMMDSTGAILTPLIWSNFPT